KGYDCGYMSTLEVKDLTVRLPKGGDRAEAVSGVSFSVERGEILCLVGESGSGKTVIAHSIMGLLPKTLELAGGEVRLEGEELTLLVADEPTTALDVTTQAQILRLMVELQRRHGMAVLFVTHDFGVVAEIAHRVAVLREGRLVELGDKVELLTRPRHEYTRML